MKKDDIVKSKKECCGCGCCQVLCPKQAIVMKYDFYGMLYPFIDNEKCVHCGKCINICAYGKIELQPSKIGYAISNTLEMQLMQSASGGVFSTI